MKVRIIANPISGGGRGEAMAQALRAALDHAGVEAELSLTQKAGDAGEMASREGADCIVSVGGDGTANEVVNGMKDTAAALAILPMGTANVVARELGIPRDPRAVAELITRGSTRRMDVGDAGGRWFLLGAGAGLDAAVTKTVSEHRGRSSSYLRWIRPAIATSITYGYPKIRVIVDGALASDRAQYAVIGNCRYSAGVFPLTPKARIDDGLLDVCLLHNLSPARLIPLALTVWNPGFIEGKNVTYLQGKRIDLEPASDEPAPIQIDGDPAGFIPATFEVVPGGIEVVAPT